MILTLELGHIIVSFQNGINYLFKPSIIDVKHAHTPHNQVPNNHGIGIEILSYKIKADFLIFF